MRAAIIEYAPSIDRSPACLAPFSSRYRTQIFRFEPGRKLHSIIDRNASRCGFGASVRSRGASLEVVQDEQADCRRQVALLAIGIDLADQLGQRHAALLGNLLHAAPKWLFEAHARLVAVGEN